MSVQYAVIVENDESEWQDHTGISYHFPKRYFNILQPDTSVVYYKGSLKDTVFREKRLTDKAHYFGTATISRIYDDKNSSKGDKFALIEHFSLFKKPVLIKQDGEYIEKIPESRRSNYWRDGVREIDENTYLRIVSLSGGPAEWNDSDGDIPADLISNDLEQIYESYEEGNKRKHYVTKHERNPILRRLAILIHGVTCKACGITFNDVYGEHGKGFIHVHHLKPISEFDGPQKVDPETDLTVLCPNCHAMVHRYKSKTLSLAELQSIIQSNK